MECNHNAIGLIDLMDIETQSFVFHFNGMMKYDMIFDTHLFHISSPDIFRISFNMAASREVFPLPLFPMMTVSLPVI